MLVCNKVCFADKDHLPDKKSVLFRLFSIVTKFGSNRDHFYQHDEIFDILLCNQRKCEEIVEEIMVQTKIS